MAIPQKTEKPAAPVLTQEQVSAIAGQVTEAQAKLSREAELTKEGLIVGAARFFLRVAPAVPYPPIYTKHSERLQAPKAAFVWPGESIVEVGTGDRPLESVNTYEGQSTIWYEQLTPSDLRDRDLASDREALRYQEAAAPAVAAKRFAEKVAADVATKRGELEDLERAIEQKKREIVEGEALQRSVSDTSDAEKAKLATWIEETRRTESAFLRALDLLARKPAAEPGVSIGPASSATVQTWRESIEEDRKREAEGAKAAPPVDVDHPLADSPVMR